MTPQQIHSVHTSFAVPAPRADAAVARSRPGERRDPHALDARAACCAGVADATTSGTPRGPLRRPACVDRSPDRDEAPNAVEIHRLAKEARSRLIGDLVVRAARALAKSARRFVRAFRPGNARTARRV